MFAQVEQSCLDSAKMCSPSLNRIRPGCLAVAVTDTAPLPSMIAGLLAQYCRRSAAGLLKLTAPPATGSPKLLLTVTCSGVAKLESARVVWLSPPVRLSVNPRLSKAPMSTVTPVVRAKPADRC